MFDLSAARIAFWTDYAGTADGLHKYVHNIPDQVRVVSEAIAQIEGEREHPLLDRNLRENPVYEMGRGIGHPAASARRAYPRPLQENGTTRSSRQASQWTLKSCSQ
jgi:hypothetical protein